MENDLEPELDEIPETLFSPWNHVLTLTASVGYKDNIALASENPDSSPFVKSELEVIAMRTPYDGTQWTFLLTAEDTRFWKGTVVDHENLILGQGEWLRFWANDWQTAFSVEAIYLDQVVDVSVDEAIREAIPVRGAAFSARPNARRELLNNFWLMIEFWASRQIYTDELDDYWEFGPKFLLGRTYGNGSEVSAGYSYIYRPYSDAEARNAEGELMPGTTRASCDQTVLLTWKHFWDADQRWRSTTKAGYRERLDNAKGYFDYERFEVSHEFRFQTEKWELIAYGRLAHYRFPVQTVTEPDETVDDKRRRNDLTLRVRAERQLTRRLRLNAQYEHERSDSNEPSEEYKVNTVSAGLSLEF